MLQLHEVRQLIACISGTCPEVAAIVLEGTVPTDTIVMHKGGREGKQDLVSTTITSGNNLFMY